MKKNPKAKRGAGRILVPLILAVCCLGFGVSAWKYFSILRADRQAETVYRELRTAVQVQPAPEPAAQSAPAEETPEQPAEETAAESRTFSVDMNGLREQYPDLAAWLWLWAGETDIDYPVMQAADNDYYLTHLYDGTYNHNGSIFIDYRNTGVLTDGNTVLYGHNMQNGGMFNPLNQYKSPEFYSAHPVMKLCTPEGDCTVELICGTVEDGNYEFVQLNFVDFNDMNDYVNRFSPRSTFESGVQLQPGDRLVSFCTCSYENMNARYMLIGRVAGTPEPD